MVRDSHFAACNANRTELSSCCGAEGRTKAGCSCTGGGSHICLKHNTPLPVKTTEAFATTDVPAMVAVGAATTTPSAMASTTATSVINEARRMRWRRLVLKVLEGYAKVDIKYRAITTEEWVLLDDAP